MSSVREVMASDMPDEIKADVFQLAGLAGGIGSFRGSGVLQHALETWAKAKGGEYCARVYGPYVDARCGSCIVDVNMFYAEIDRVGKHMSSVLGIEAPPEEQKKWNPPDELTIRREIAKELEVKIQRIKRFEWNGCDRFSFAVGETDYSGVPSSEVGETLALDELENDDELWKMAVESGNTREGQSEWAQTVINSDGWEEAFSRGNEMHELPCGAYFCED